MKLKFNYITLLLLMATMFVSCSSINNQNVDNSLLIGNSKRPKFDDVYQELNKFNSKDSNFILYTLFYYSIAYPINKIPQSITQYLFIPREKKYDKLIGSEKYFEVYKYTNYQKVVRLNDAEYKEYDNLIEMIKSIILNEKIECDGYSSSSPSIGYYLYFNMFDSEKRVNSIDNNLLSKNNPNSYYCLSSYLRTILFEKEYNLDNFIE
ncbi:MAG: hypothetical protein CVV25_13995 [Ignavibacteriae bacterium HGW-Ignavibacteriae-4]|nr:MAG: hypothetical protein CVV25_13995 [Ignavibacteriae bacterium HGW-Ignavibacteriae-4]